MNRGLKPTHSKKKTQRSVRCVHHLPFFVLRPNPPNDSDTTPHRSSCKNEKTDKRQLSPLQNPNLPELYQTYRHIDASITTPGAKKRSSATRTVTESLLKSLQYSVRKQASDIAHIVHNLLHAPRTNNSIIALTKLCSQNCARWCP
jgi:hypothetical protein